MAKHAAADDAQRKVEADISIEIKLEELTEAIFSWPGPTEGGLPPFEGFTREEAGELAVFLLERGFF